MKTALPYCCIPELLQNIVLTQIRCLVSGTGAYACQLAKNVFHAGKVITTVSTAKIPRVPELLGKGVVDQGTFSMMTVLSEPVDRADLISQ